MGKKKSELIGYSYTDEQIEYIVSSRNDGVSFQDIADQFNSEFSSEILRDKSPETIRGQYEKYKNIDFGRDNHLKAIRSSHSTKKSNSKTAKENRLLLDYMESSEEFLDSFKDVVKDFKFSLHKPVKKGKSKKKIKRAIFGKLSDLHIQSQIDEDELGGINRYGNLEEARRLAFYMREIGNYKKDHREETELILPLNGDLGAGIIHDQESTPLITTQFSAIVHLLLQGITYAAGKYNKVRVVGTSGNHLRLMHKGNKGRQTAQKWDNYSTMIYIALKHALKSYPNVTVEIPITPYALIEVLGHKYLITHGDTFLSVGNVGKNVSTDIIKNKVNDLMSGLGPIDCVVVGHVHVPLYTTLNNGTELVINGTMSGIDPFAQSIGIVKNNPCQVMFEATEKYPVGDVRFVKLQEADDNDELDSIIIPFKGKF